MDFAQAAILIFEPVYLYTLGYTLGQIMLFYAGVYAAYVLILPFALRVLRRFGVEHSILFSHFFFIGYLLTLIGIGTYPLLIVVAPILYAIQKTLYWPAFHIDFILFSDMGQRGREVSAIIAVSSLMYILGPLAGGFLLAWKGFSVLFIMASTFFFLSAIPLMRLKEIHTLDEESYAGAMHHLKDASQRRKLTRIAGFGEELISMYAWPVFIFVIVHNFAEMGSLITGATLITTLLVLLIGRTTDSRWHRSLGRIGVFGSVATWLLRGAASTAGFVFGVDTMGRLSKSMIYVPLMTDVYEETDRKKIASGVIFFEQALSIGKIVAALGAWALTLIFPNPWTAIFIMAGMFTLLYLRGSRKQMTA